jgi:predicted ATPase
VQAGHGAAALTLYVGELLPGHYDPWIDDERKRLAALAERMQQWPGPPPGLADTPPAAAATAPPLPPAAPTRLAPALPAYLARFFGREAELAELAALLAHERLITLGGPGGSGKTRLSAEVARREREAGRGRPQPARRFDTVAFVALADCRRSAELPSHIRSALRLPPGADDVFEQLQQALQDQPALLVLDNLEQLVEDGVAVQVERLLQALPSLHLLVSSRRRLGLAGERCVELQPLPLPDPGETDLSRCAANPCVALFVDRAQAARAHFHLHTRNREKVVALCLALQGVPLALELAAARAHALSVADICAQLDGRLDPRPGSRFSALARGPGRSSLPRHASLDAAIDWSWQLASEGERRFLAGLSEFRDGFTAHAAAAVLNQPDSADTLARLVADSLVQTSADDGPDAPMRYRLLEMVREFAAQRLAHDERLVLRQRHRDFHAALARERGRALLAADRPNVQAALVSAVADGLPQQAMALSLASAPLWEREGVPLEVRDTWLAAVQARAAAPAAAGDDTLLHEARCFFARRLYEAGHGGDAEAAVQLADDAVAAAGSDRRRRASALALQLRLRWKGRPRSDEGLSTALREALALTLPQGDGSAGTLDPSDRRSRAELLNLMGEVMVLGQGDADAALTFYDEALALFQALGDERQVWDVRLGQGICAQVQRRFDDAVALHRAVAEAAQRLDDPLLLIDAHNNLAVACTLARRWPEAVRHGQQQLQAARQRHARYMQLMALWNLARPLARCGQAERAAQVLACAVREWQQHYGALTPRDWRYVQRVQRLVAVQLGAAGLQQASAAGAALPLAEAVQRALSDAGLVWAKDGADALLTMA